jgi:hypothetical protein
LLETAEAILYFQPLLQQGVVVAVLFLITVEKVKTAVLVVAVAENQLLQQAVLGIRQAYLLLKALMVEPVPAHLLRRLAAVERAQREVQRLALLVETVALEQLTQLQAQA